MRKAASIFQQPTGFILQALAPIGRAWLAADPVLRVPSSASAQELGQALLTVLQQEQAPADWPTDWKEFGKLNLRRLGMKTMKQLHTDCKSCHVTIEGETVRIEPSANEKTRFVFLANRTIVLESTQPAVMGNAILEALSQST